MIGSVVEILKLPRQFPIFEIDFTGLPTKKRLEIGLIDVQHVQSAWPIAQVQCGQFYRIPIDLTTPFLMSKRSN